MTGPRHRSDPDIFSAARTPGDVMVSRAHERRLGTAWLWTVAVIVSGGCAARQPAGSFLDLQERRIREIPCT